MEFETFLRNNGYQQKEIQCVCPHCITVSEFAIKHPKGKYVLFCQDTAIIVINGCYVDLSGNADQVVLYYYKKEEE